MKGIWKKGFWAVFCLAFCLVFGTSPAKAGSGVKCLTAYANSSRTVYADVTGDGKKDEIRLGITTLSGLTPPDRRIKTMQVYVNGKKALKLGNEGGDWVFTHLYSIRMTKSRVFLQIIGYDYHIEEKHVFNRIYRYDTKKKKLVKVFDLGGRYMNSADCVVRATGKEIRVSHIAEPEETGWIRWYFTYTYKNGKFTLKKTTANAWFGRPVWKWGDDADGWDGDGYNKYFKKSKFIVANKRSFYTDTNLKNVAFTAQEGNVLTLKKVKVNGKKIYLQFQNGEKAGWQRIKGSGVYNYKHYDPDSTGWFHGVYDRLSYAG